MIMEKKPAKQEHQELKNADYFVWRIQHAKRELHDERVRHLYNMRARERITRH
jgi:hypothetical protein